MVKKSMKAKCPECKLPRNCRKFYGVYIFRCQKDQLLFLESGYNQMYCNASPISKEERKKLASQPLTPLEALDALYRDSLNCSNKHRRNLPYFLFVADVINKKPSRPSLDFYRARARSKELLRRAKASKRTDA